MAQGIKTTVKIGSAPTKGYFSVVKGSKNAAFGVPNNAIYAKNTQSRLGREIADALMAETFNQSGRERDLREERKVLVSAIRYGANVEARRMIDFMTSKMIGVRGASTGITLKDSFFKQGLRTAPKWKPAFPTGGAVEWAQLSLQRLHQKRNDAYFSDTGELKRTLSGMRASYPAALGGIVVKERDMTRKGLSDLSRRAGISSDAGFRRVILGSIDIQIFPNAKPNLFPGLLSGSWDQIDARAALEASSFFPENIRDKLRGAQRNGYPYRFRPMAGPVTQFWMMHRIPAAIALAIHNGTRKRDRSDDWMK